VPVGGVWNYSSGLGAQFTPSNPYNITLAGQPLPFWAPEHRPNHFAQFVAVEGEEGLEVDREDAFA
jgi:pre-mRNA-processing factor 8